MLNLIAIIALLNTTFIHVAKKWQWLDYYQATRKKWMPKADCYLCLSFWMALSQVWIIFFLFGHGSIIGLLITPTCSCSLTNFLVNNSLWNDYK